MEVLGVKAPCVLYGLSPFGVLPLTTRLFSHPIHLFKSYPSALAFIRYFSLWVGPLNSEGYNDDVYSASYLSRCFRPTRSCIDT